MAILALELSSSSVRELTESVLELAAEASVVAAAAATLVVDVNVLVSVWWTIRIYRTPTTEVCQVSKEVFFWWWKNLRQQEQCIVLSL